MFKSGFSVLFAFLILLALSGIFPGLASDEEAPTLIIQFAAEEANQGVAVDDEYVYAIASTRIGKYEKKTGQLIKQWSPTPDLPLIHLDSGVVVGDLLYCAHSNYPHLPMTSSIEIWDTETLDHIGSHSFGILEGSCTWLDFYDGHWWGVFAHYDGRGGYEDKDNKWTTLVQFDERWNRLQAWVFPPEVLKRFGSYSCSGGSWGPDGLLYCTGHDLPEVYVLRLPQAGSVLELERIIPFPNQGQGIAFDRSAPGLLFGIQRSEKRVIAAYIADE